MKRILFIAVAGLLLFSACKKDDDTVTYTAGYESLKSAYNDLVTMPTVVTYDADEAASIVGPEGCVFHFPANCFVDPEGFPVTGKVTVTLREWLRKGDMLFSRILPTSDSDPLTSGGEVYVTATQGNTKLSMKPGVNYTVQMPYHGGKGGDQMLFFLGHSSVYFQNGANTVNWHLDPANGGVNYYDDTLNIFSDTLGYVSAARFLVNPEYKSFKVNITGAAVTNNDNVAAYALYDGYKAVWPMYVNDNGVISEARVPGLPVHFVVVAIIDGDFYGGMSSATPMEDGVYSVSISRIDPHEFKKQLNELP